MSKAPDVSGRWVQVFCRGVGFRGRTCANKMGDLCLDYPARVRLYCRAKHKDGKRRLEEFKVTEDGEVLVTLIPADVRLPYYETAVLITEDR